MDAAFKEIFIGKGYFEYEWFNITTFYSIRKKYSKKAWLTYPFQEGVEETYARIGKIYDEKHGRIKPEKKETNNDDTSDLFEF